MYEDKDIGIKSANYIKDLLTRFYIDELGRNTIIGDEIMYGTKRKMVDLVLLQKGLSYAIEIKAENDSLKRLEGQINEYRKIFNYVIVCATDKHLTKISKKVTNDIGLCLAQNNGIVIIRPPKFQEKLDKEEMLFTISSAFLKKENTKLRNLNSDEVREVFGKEKLETIQSLLITFLKNRIESKFQLYGKQRDESLIDDSVISALEIA
jgi:hypothetical protein